MNRFFCVVVVVVVAAVGSGCTNTSVTVLTQAPPGRTASLDVESQTLRVTRGLAVVLECTEYDETYSGPCRELDVDVEGDDVVDVFDVHLDAFAGQTVNDTSAYGEQSLSAPATRSGVLLAARASGDATVTLTPQGQPMVLSLIVEDAPGDDDEEEATEE